MRNRGSKTFGIDLQVTTKIENSILILLRQTYSLPSKSLRVRLLKIEIKSLGISGEMFKGVCRIFSKTKFMKFLIKYHKINRKNDSPRINLDFYVLQPRLY